MYNQTNYQFLKKITDMKTNSSLYITIAFFLLYYLIGLQEVRAQGSTGSNVSYTFIVPDGVRLITVEAWGGGGRGGERTSGSNVALAGGGGGAYSRSLLSVSPGDLHTATPGAGSNSTAAGSDSWFSSTAILLAKGGGSVADNSNAPGPGGLASLGVGDLRLNGGNGAIGSGGSFGGGGGSSAGTALAGNFLNTTTNQRNGAIAPSGGGNGGTGAANNTSGLAGSGPGGGGGGGYRAGSFSTEDPGNGADGYVAVSWVCLNNLTSAVDTDDQTVCIDTPIIDITYLLSGEDIDGGNVTGLPAGVGSSFNASTGVITISGSPSEAGIFNYTVTPTGGCTGTTANGTIEVIDGQQITIQPVTPPAFCEDAGVNTISVTASGIGLTYQWRKGGIDLSETPPYSNVNSSTLTITNPSLSENGASIDVVVNGSCSPTPVTSDAVILTVDAAANGGSLTGGTTPICDGSSTGNMTLSGYTGSIEKWQKQVNGGGWQDISHTSDTYAEIPDSDGSWEYRVVVESGVCTDVSTTVSITVDPATVAGSVSGGSTICLTENTGTLTLGGYTGSILRWQKRLDGGGWQDIVHTNDTYSEVPSSVGSWDYRAEVQSGVCAAGFSAHTTVTVNANSVGGSVSGGNTPICLGESTGTMTLSGHTGTVNKWQRRLDGGGWADIVNATTTHSEIPASAGTWDYRAEVQNGSCAAEFSGFTSIVVLPRPTAVLSGSGSICLGQAVTLTLSVTAVGDWELNLDNGGGTFTGNGSGSFPAVVYPPTNTTYSITDMFDSQCTSEPGDLTGSATINVDEDCQVIYINAPDPLEAEISGTETICSGETVTITVTLSGGNQPWSIFVMPSTLYDNITGTEPFDFTFQVTPSSSITYDNTNIFVGDDEGCAPTVTGSAVITVYDEILFTVDYADISCFGANDGEITVTVTQGTAPFEFSIDNGQNYTSPQASPYTFTGLGPGDYDIRVRDASGCESPECP